MSWSSLETCAPIWSTLKLKKHNVGNLGFPKKRRRRANAGEKIRPLSWNRPLLLLFHSFHTKCSVLSATRRDRHDCAFDRCNCRKVSIILLIFILLLTRIVEFVCRSTVIHLLDCCLWHRSRKPSSKTQYIVLSSAT